MALSHRVSEGTVWRGRFQGTMVAIKRAKVEFQAKVFEESEIAFMIALQHDRLVRFIGAGQIWDDLNQGDVVFSVQVILLLSYMHLFCQFVCCRRAGVHVRGIIGHTSVG